MLTKIDDVKSNFLRFNSITPNSQGTGVVFCYNAVMKRTKSDKPFVTLYLRDVSGATVPGYIFDLDRPIFAGRDVSYAVGSPLSVTWQENYLKGIGMTLILNKVERVNNLPAEDLKLFVGGVEDIPGKVARIKSFFSESIGLNVDMPFYVTSEAFLDYSGGRIGGLCEHYDRLLRMLKTVDYFGEAEMKKLAATALVYIFVHSNFVRLSENDNIGIDAINSLSDTTRKYAKQLSLDSGCLELVHSFFGYTPQDIYVRTILSLAQQVEKIGKEFNLYRTLPLNQKGDAGYGTIQRYTIEDCR